MTDLMPTRLAPDEQVGLLAGLEGVPSFDERLAMAGAAPLQATDLGAIQVNVGRLCNQACAHCHVDAGPHRREVMTWETFAAVLDVIRATRPRVVDITGGAPELNPSFRRFVTAVRNLGIGEIIDRCNLTVLLLSDQADLVPFLREHRVHIVASLPAVDEQRTDAQRGRGIFGRSIRALHLLNEFGYGRQTDLELTLMANPSGAFLPPPQATSEDRFRRILEAEHGIQFTRLVQLTNMPISRFLEFLVRRDLVHDYLGRLQAAFNPGAVPGLMCRDTLSVSWDGGLYDCDFNQMLELPVVPEGARSVFDFRADLLAGRPIATGRHCFGCTAGQGSSCGGATVERDR